MTIRKILLAGFLLAAVPAAFADGIPVEPGLWEMTLTMNMPMLPKPRVNTVTECMEKSEISMDGLGTEDMDPACSFVMEQLDGDTMKWTVD